MTREEAIRALRYERKTALHENKSAFDMAIKALSAEPCEDCISRQAVLAYIEFILTHGMGKKKSFEFIKKFVGKLPSVTPKHKMGRWIAEEDEDMNTVGYYCSECDLPMETEERTKFCPNCGAKMQEVDE